MVLGRQGPLAKATTSSMGLMQEYKADRQARSKHKEELQPPAANNAAAGRSPSPSDADSEEDDEAWAQDLDAAEEELRSAPPPQGGSYNASLHRIQMKRLTMSSVPS